MPSFPPCSSHRNWVRRDVHGRRSSKEERIDTGDLGCGGDGGPEPNPRSRCPRPRAKTPSGGYVSTVQDLSYADLEIEAIVENKDVKKKLFVELDKITKPSTILASNTR